ncbi:TPA: hypothetical protein ACOOZ1_001818 [Streptococcus pneumoniae]
MKLNEVRVKDFNFGDVDGSDESLEPKFQDLFYDEDSFYEKELSKKKKFIIYGRKGTGKTLLASYLNEKMRRNANQSSKIVSYDEYICEKLKEFKYDSVKKEEQSLFWRYVFLQQFVDLIKKDYEYARFWQFYRKRKIKKLIESVTRQFLEVQQFINEDSTEIKNSGKFNSKISDLGAELQVNSSSGSTQKTTSIESPYFKKYKEIETEVLNYLKASSKVYFIFFDDMDRLEETMDLDEFIDLMISMIYGAQSLNRKIEGNSKIVLLLRSDILKLLFGKSGDVNKPITSGGIELIWYESNAAASDSPLIKMVLYKMSKSIDDNLPLSEIRRNFFPTKDTIFKYMMSRSFGRPRDIVSFFNIYKKKFPEDQKIVLNNMQRVEKEYSEWFYKEISNELKITGKFDEVDKLLKSISELGKYEFTYHKLFDFMQKRQGNTDELLELLTLLVQLGVLGIRLNTGNIEFRYRDYNIDKPVNIHTKFVVHYGLRKLLSISFNDDNEKNIIYQ